MAINGKIDALPDDILLSIFIKGCEDALDEHPLSCFRSLKDFARIACQVNRRWHALIKLPPNKSFYIACLFLKASPPEDHQPARFFAKQITTFRRQLLTSQGCDLVVMFLIELLGTQGSQDSNLLLKLLAYAVDFILPYHKQVVKVSLKGNQWQFCSYLLENLTSRWTAALRLVDISIQPIFLERTPTTFSNLKSLMDEPIQRSIIPRKPQVASFATLIHIHNLDTIILPDCSWLNSELHLPPSLRNLEIAEVDAKSISLMYTYLTANPLLCNHLRSIVVGAADGVPQSMEVGVNSVMWSRNSNSTKLPLVRSITMHGIALLATNFLAECSLASLEEVSLTIYEDVITPLGNWQSRIGPRIRKIHQTSPHIRESLLNGLHDGLEAPILKSISISTQSSGQLFSCLSVFIKCPIETMSLRRNRNQSLSRGQEWTDELARLSLDIISSFHPRLLELRYIPVLWAEFITRFVDARLLRTLKLITSHHGWSSVDDGPALSNRPLSYSPSQIEMPALTRLSISGPEDHAIFFLSRLSADCLERLDLIDPEPYFAASPRATHDVDKQADGSFKSVTNSLPSVRFVEYELLCPPIPVGCWEFLPNVEELRVQIDEGSPRLPEIIWEPLAWDGLGPGPEGGNTVPLPRLRVLFMSHRRIVHDTLLISPDLIHEAEEQMRRGGERLLEHRRKSGALPLAPAKPLQFSYERGRAQDISTLAKIQVDLEACLQVDSDVTDGEQWHSSNVF